MDVERLDDFARRHIRHKVKQLIGREGFARSDVEDLQQDLTLDLLRRLPHFDPARASRNTFTVRVVAHRIASIIQHRQAAMRDYRRNEHSLNETIHDEEEGPVEVSQTIDHEANRTGRSSEELGQLKFDVACVIANLPEDLKEFCICLKTQSPSEISREAGVPRPTLYEPIKKLRQRLEDAGLRNYL